MQKRLGHLLIFMALAHCARGQGLCPGPENHCVEALTFKQMFEVAKGPSDGQNKVFQVSQIPAPQYPIHVFRNGLELTPGKDFTLQANYITLTSRAIETGGDLIQAAYTVQMPSDRSVPVAGQSLQLRGAINDVLDRFLDRALTHELAITSSPSSSPSQGATAPMVSVKPTPTVTTREQTPITESKPVYTMKSSGECSSLRMLSAALARSTQANDGDLKKKQLGVAVSAEGLEGLGDSLTASPFDIFSRPNAGTPPKRDMKNIGSATPSVELKRPTPASLRMLQRALQVDK